MSIIKLLDKHTINQIAAGEVIERPASVVKEMIENSIDSGARAITCEIGEGGISLIRITDNGSGIAEDDIRTAFLRHATSKIKSAEDLGSVRSLGFRGEALASIAEVAKVELITKTREAFTGIRYIINAGEEELFEEVGCPDGTTFVIRDLFAAIPVRRKFLKAPVTEAGYITEAMERLAISHPDISFKYINNGRVVFFTNGSDSVKSIVYSLYGRDIAGQLVEVDYETEDIKVKGFVAKPLVARSNRNLESYYVNGRFVRNSLLIKAIEDAYAPYMMQHKYPFTVLYIDVNNDLIDVNVHPAKLEIRFRRQEQIYDAVYFAVHNALSHKTLVPEMNLEDKADRQAEDKAREVRLKEEREAIRLAPEPFESKRAAILQEGVRQVRAESVSDSRQVRAESVSDSRQVRVEFVSDSRQVLAEPASTSEQMELVPASDSKQAVTGPVELEVTINKSEEAKAEPIKEYFSRQLKLDIDSGSEITTVKEETKEDFKQGINDGYKIIGQVFNTYWILERGNKMYLVDQHAAHEKIIYERLVGLDEEAEVSCQLLSPPLVISLSATESTVVEAHKDQLLRMGFAVDNFGGREYTVSSVPLQLYKLDPKELLLEVIDSLASDSGRVKTQALKDRLATCACKAAVKGNTRLSREEARSLIEELITLENPFNCPHGRPVVVEMTDKELERKFKRIV